LGKKFSTTGAIIHTGQTPVKALGATDQHSQVQLYAEGPFDKVVTFVRVLDYEAKGIMPLIREEPKFAYLGGGSMAELMTAEALGTEVAIRMSERPSVAFELDKVSPESVGGLLFILELATAFAGKFYGINPFDQPGVEAGKNAAYALMGRPGFEKESREIRKSLKGMKSYVVK
jgi:glucose-6-phosphate isomerase